MTRRQVVLQRLLGILATCLFALAMLPTPDPPMWVRVAAVGVVLLVVVTLVIWRIRLSPHLTTNEHNPAVPFDDLPGIELLAEVWNDNVRGKRRLQRLVRLVAIRRGMIGRVSDYVDLTAETFNMEVETAWILPPGVLKSGAQSWFPVFTPIKGTLVDRLQVTDGEGNALPLLPIRDVQRITLQAWKFMVTKLVLTVPSTTADERRRLYELGGSHILQVVPRNQRQNAIALDQLSARAVDELQAALQSAGIPPSPLANVATTFLETLATRFLVIAMVTLDEQHMLVRHSHRLEIPRRVQSVLTHDSDSVRRKINQLKHIVGADSPLICYDVSLARAASSYHLEFLVPRQNYIAAAVLEDTSGGMLDRPPKSQFGVERWYFRHTPPGRRTGHFYSRGLGTLGKPLQVSVRISEYPWGSLLKALIFSGIATVCMGLTTTVVHLSGTDGTTVAFTLVGLPFTLGVTWLSLFPGTTRLATAAFAYAITAVVLLLLALNALACAGEINEWHHFWSGHSVLVSTYRASIGITLAALATFAIRIGVWRRTYLRKESH